MNSIAAYLIAHLFEEFIVDSFHINLGPHVFQIFGTALEPLTQGAVVLLTYWLILWWMYRRKLILEDLVSTLAPSSEPEHASLHPPLLLRQS